jgi:hypothetical protein
MDNCIKITGSNVPANRGITALTESGQLTTLASYAIGAQWAQSAPTSLANAQGICGNNNNGIVVFGGKSSQYLISVAIPRAAWIPLPDFDNEIAGMVGDRVNGITLFSAAVPATPATPAVPRSASTDPDIPAKPATPKQDSVVAQLVVGDDNVGEWKRKTPPPFDVTLMAGDSVNGVLVAGVDGGVTSLAQSGPDCNCDWKKLQPLLFAVEMMTGDCANGFVFAGAGLMVMIDAKGNRTQLPVLNHELIAITGNPKDGVAALVKGGVVAYCSDLTKAVWVLLGGPITAPTAAAQPAPKPAPSTPPLPPARGKGAAAPVPPAPAAEVVLPEGAAA